MIGEICRMQEENLAEVLEIQASLGFQNWSRESFLSEIRNVNYSLPRVFKIDTILGYMVDRIVGDEAELCSIAVRREHMGSGVAQALLQNGELDLQARGVTRHFLEVRISNQRAIGFYHKNAFQDVGIRKGYYADGENALLMARSIIAHA